MYASVQSGSLFGLEGEIVNVETDLTPGLPVFNVVGLPDTAVKEARDRIRAALVNSGYRFPMCRITVNLSPANTKKEGTHFDLPIAIGLLMAEGQNRMEAEMARGCAVLGELSLEGDLVPVRGALPLAISLREKGIRRLILPAGNAEEVGILEDMEFLPVSRLREVPEAIRKGPEAVKWIRGHRYEAEPAGSRPPALPDFSQVRGQEQAKRALQISAAGGHSILMMGPPGAGKTMLARRLPGILPPMQYEEILETTKIYSVAGELCGKGGIVRQRPFRAPHHTASAAALAGGGSRPRPGEISLAHGGVLFLDELPEFPRSVLEVLRQPLEEKNIRISRSAGIASFPADFILVAACNPCPCGYYGDGTGRCACSAGQIRRYMERLSGPLMDRIDLHISLSGPEWSQLAPEEETHPLNTETMREAVCRARKRQIERFAGESILCNAQIPSHRMEQYCEMEPKARLLLKEAFDRLHLSARAYRKVLLVSQTIADLEGESRILESHAAEAIGYRLPEWGVSENRI